MSVFFTSCCVIVDPPCATTPEFTSLQSARRIDFGSTPRCEKNVRSSIETTAAMTPGETCLSVTGARSSVA